MTSRAIRAKPLSTHVTASITPRTAPSWSSRVWAWKPSSVSADFTASSLAAMSATVAVAEKYVSRCSSGSPRV